MADKQVQIRIATAGGDQAAAEIRKVEQSLTATNEASQEAARTLGDGALAPAVRRSVRDLQNLNAEGQRVNRTTLSMAGGFSNVGYQLQDFAVQVGAGQGVLRAFAQQAPQLLSGFGPLGITLGTIAAVAVPVAAGLMDIGESAEEAAPSVEEFNDRLEELRKRAAEVAAKKSAEELQEWIDALDDETVAIQDQNRARERELDLVNATRKAKAETDEARREADIAAIEADPNKSDAQKIREVAAVNERGARAKAQGELDDLTMKRAEAERKVIGETNLVADAERKLREVTKERAVLEKERALVQGRVDASEGVETGISATRKAMEDLAKERLAVVGAAGLGKADTSGLDKRQADLEKELARLEEIKKVSEADKGRLRDEFTINAATLTEREEQAKKDKKDAEKRAKDAREAAQAADKLQAINAPEIVTRYQQGVAARGSSAESKAREAQQRDDEEAKRKKEQDDREADRKKLVEMRSDLGGAREGLDETARGYGRNIRKSGLGSGNDIVAQIGKQLSDGTNSSELQKLGDLVEENQEKLGAKYAATLEKIIASLNREAKRVDNLEGQIKNFRNGR